MCLGIPGRVVETYREHDVLMGKVDFGGISKRVCLEHVPDVRVDEYVLVHVGFALSRIDEAEARRVFEFLDSMDQLDELEEPVIAMKYLDEYRDGAAAEKLAAAIARTVTRPWTIMEVCGGQTHTIVKYGIDTILPPAVELVHGPGCPVCVTALETIDRAHAIASRPDVIFCSFGDMLRVPGVARRPARAEVAGQRRPGRLLAARRREPRGGQSRSQGRLLRHRLRDDGAAERDGRLAWRGSGGSTNFSVLGLARPRAAGDDGVLLESPDNRVQGFLGPGHVCAVMGCGEYGPIARPIRRADRDHGLRAARPARRDLSDASGSSRRAGPRSRTPTPAPSGPRGTRRRGG